MLGGIVLAVGVTAPTANAQQATGPQILSITHSHGHTTETVKAGLTTKEVQEIQQIRMTRTDQARSIPLAAALPSCSGTWEDINAVVDWEFDDTDRLTFESDATWDGFVGCTDMAFENVGSNLFLRGNQVALGTTGSCGAQGATSGNCGFAGTSNGLTPFTCSGVGNCDGGYFAAIGIAVQLPVGFLWDPTTLPTECSAVAANTELLCVFNTSTITVPAVN